MTQIKRVFSRNSGWEQLLEKSPMTVREKVIVRLVVQGCCNSDIAKRLSIDERTVQEEMNSIFDKLAVSNRFELALYAIYGHLINQITF